MRRPISAPALTATVLGIALSAPMLSAQQVPPESPPPIYPMMGARGASHMLRTGWDYIQYEEYERALKYLREAETRQPELSVAERQALKQGIERAQRGMREAVGGSNRSYALSGSRRAGAITLAPTARDPKAPALATAVPPEPIQLTSGTSSARPKGEPPVPADRKESAAPAPAPALPEVALTEPAPLPVPAMPPPAAAPALVPNEPDPAPLPPLSSEPGSPSGAPAPLPDLAPRAEERPNLPAPRPDASNPGPSTPIAVPGPETEALPPLPDMAAPAPVEPPPAPSADSFPVPAPSRGPAPAQGAAELPPLPAETSPSPAPAPDAVTLPPLPVTPPTASDPLPPLPVESSSGSAPETSSRPGPRGFEDPPSMLSPELQREVDRIARQQDAEEMTRNRDAVRPAPAEAPVGDAPGMPDTSANRLESPRPPSPTEARPLRAIPVPEEFVPLARRDWAPNRKVWAASGICQKPLYFQDAALERYGQTAEQYVGPLGRFLSYPLDDPTQSNQRNQIAQPFFSMGLFAAQIVMLPYNMLVDPPWEAEYDLGYYRPGDRVPTDVYYFPLHGVGPPFRGSNY